MFFVVFSPFCSHCAELVRQRMYKFCAVTVRRHCSRSVVYHNFRTIHWFSPYRTVTLPLMQINCYSSLPLKVQSSCAVIFHGRQLSTTRVASSVIGRLLRLRYILLTGAVGGGITVHQVTTSRL